MEKFRLLRADEIECKVSRFIEGDSEVKGLALLLYKTARTDMDLLDETVGIENWATDYKEIKGNLYCGIGIRTAPEMPFVWKWDCGIESREDDDGNEKKGEASDAFKRAGFKVGIGRELYTAPFIFVPANKVTIKKKRNGKPCTYDKFSVEKIVYDENRRISAISICNDTLNKRACVWQEGKAQ